jgi:hypothetical protein
MNKEQYLNLISADITSKIPGDFPKFDPTILLLVGKVVLILIEECYLNEDRAKDPGFLDRIRLRLLLRNNLSWSEYRKYGAEIHGALLKYGEETDKMTLSRTINRLREE